MPDAPDFATTIAAAYAVEGASIDLGRGVHDDTLAQDAKVQIALSMMNRHGLVAGATGTGKTKTLQGMAEQLSAQGVPTFVADVKGDLSGLAVAGDAEGIASKRDGELGIPYEPTAFPVEFLSIGGLGPGVPVRATVSDFGADAAREGAREQRDAGVEPRARLPLRRHEGAAAARPERPARAADVPGLRRGQGGARGHRRPLEGDGRRAAARPRRPGDRRRQRVLRRARSSRSATCCAPRRTAAASSAASSWPRCRTSPSSSRPC